MGLDFYELKLNCNSKALSFFSVKKEEQLKRSLEEKNSQIYIRRSQVSHSIVHLRQMAFKPAIPRTFNVSVSMFI